MSPTARAIAFAIRDDADGGKLTALDPMTSIIRRSCRHGRSVRRDGFATPSSKWSSRSALVLIVATRISPPTCPPATCRRCSMAAHPSAITVNGRHRVGLDAALPALGKSSAPSAWIVPGAEGLLPPAEQAALQAIAPVVPSADALAALPDQPLKLSKGLAGFGFYDAAGQLVLVISNPATGPDAGAVSGTVQLAKLEAADGTHRLRNLLTGATQPVTVSMHATAFPVELARWDMIVLLLAQS